MNRNIQLDYNRLSSENYLSKKPVADPFLKIDYESRDYSSYIDFVNPDSAINYGNLVKFVISPSQGDCLQNICLSITLNPLQKTSGTFACYTNTIGYALIEYIDFKIGESKIFRKYREECDYDFLFNYNKQQGSANVVDESQNRMIGKYSNILQLQTNALNASTFLVPLNSFMDKEVYKSLNLFYIQHQSIEVFVKLAPFENIVNYDGNTPPLLNTLPDFRLCCTFINLTKITKEILTKSSSNLTRFISSNYSILPGQSKSIIDFPGDTTQLVFAFRTIERRLNNDFFNYSYFGGPIIKNLMIQMNGNIVVPKTDENIFKQHTNYYKLVPCSKYIYTVSFSDNPTNWVVYTGSLNLRDAKELELIIELNPVSGLSFDDIEIIVFSKKYNWLVQQDSNLLLKFDE